MGKLVLLRHGESIWNKKNLFTGWIDIPLSENGINEAFNTGEKISEIDFDLVYVSKLERSIQTAMLIMIKNKSEKSPIIIHNDIEWSNIEAHNITNYIPVYQDQRLNERYYGKLQGKNKKEVGEQFGVEQLKKWRRSYSERPPNGESLCDTVTRTKSFLIEEIVEKIDKNNILVVAHGNSVRSLIMQIENISENEICTLEIGTCVPIIYEYRNKKFNKC